MDSFAALKDQVDIWSLAREGLQAGANGKVDVLVVAAWAQGMLEPAIFTQQFSPKSIGGFLLIGPIAVQGQPPSELDRIAASFLEGVEAHPKAHLWATWHGGVRTELSFPLADARHWLLRVRSRRSTSVGGSSSRQVRYAKEYHRQYLAKNPDG